MQVPGGRRGARHESDEDSLSQGTRTDLGVYSRIGAVSRKRAINGPRQRKRCATGVDGRHSYVVHPDFRSEWPLRSREPPCDKPGDPSRAEGGRFAHTSLQRLDLGGNEWSRLPSRP